MEPATTKTTPVQNSAGRESPKMMELATADRNGAAYEATAMRDTLPKRSPWFQHAYPAAIDPVAHKRGSTDAAEKPPVGAGAP